MSGFVWVVIGGIDYEGEVLSSLKVFDNELSALKYKESLEQNEIYDYARIKNVSIND